MKIAISGSLNFAHEMKKISDKLVELRHSVVLLPSAVKILSGEYSLDEIKRKKSDGTVHEMSVANDAIRRYYKIVESVDALLVVNLDKNGVVGYIGGSAFMEMGFAHVLRKKIFLLNPVPKMGYTDEILAMEPVVIDRDLSAIA